MSRHKSAHPWVQVHSLSRARVLLILPCNAAACVGNYFRADVYRKSGWGAALNARTAERGWIILMQAAGVRRPGCEAAA